MSELYDRIVSQRGSLEQLVARIPGFRGYQDSQARRQADRMLRDHLAEQLDHRISRLVRIEKIILDNFGMSYMTRTRDVKGRLQLYHDRIQSAAPGYAGLWAHMKIGADELERLYSFDEAQIRYIDQIDQALEKLEQSALHKEGLDEAIMQLDNVVSEAIEAYDLRDDALTDLSKSV